MNLVACVGSDKENWGQITALMHRMETEKVVLLVRKGVSGFPVSGACEVIETDTSIALNTLKQLLVERLRKTLAKEFDVALSLASGNGKEHMALVAALLSVPVGVHLVAYTKDGVQFLT